MTVPPEVPANVPAAAAADATADAPTRRGRAGKFRQRNDGTVAHLTGGAGGWRFQLRVPAALREDFRFADLAPIIRASLGPRGRGEARRLARQFWFHPGPFCVSNQFPK
jgi:hypothetical protein